MTISQAVSKREYKRQLKNLSNPKKDVNISKQFWDLMDNQLFGFHKQEMVVGKIQTKLIKYHK